MLISYKRSQTSVILRVKILDSSVTTGAGKTGLAFNTASLIISTIADNEATATAYTAAGSTVETVTTLGTYAAPTATKCRFKEVDATNHKGVYEIQLADARFAVASAKSLLLSISGPTNAAECDALIPLTDLDPYTSLDVYWADISFKPGLTIDRYGVTWYKNGVPLLAGEASGGKITVTKGDTDDTALINNQNITETSGGSFWYEAAPGALSADGDTLMVKVAATIAGNTYTQQRSFPVKKA